MSEPEEFEITADLEELTKLDFTFSYDGKVTEDVLFARLITSNMRQLRFNTMMISYLAQISAGQKIKATDLRFALEEVRSLTNDISTSMTTLNALLKERNGGER